MTLNLETQNALKELYQIDGKIKQLSTALKKYKERQSFLKKVVEKGMIQTNIKVINLPSGDKFTKYTKKSRPSVNKKWVSGRLQIYCETKQLDYKELYDFIYDPSHRPQQTTIAVKTVRAKKKK